MDFPMNNRLSREEPVQDTNLLERFKENDILLVKQLAETLENITSR